jgi:galactose mutarotase-like enzyme
MQQRIRSEALCVLINEAGAEVCSVTNNHGLEYLWQANPEVWPRHAPVLFPIVGRLKANTIRFNNTLYELGQHGFARDMAFVLLEKQANSCSFELHSTDKSKRNYPFDFKFQISYTLQGSTLSCQYTVINPGQEPLFFSVGAHPGFRCPLLPQESFEDYYLEFEQDRLYYTELNDGLRTDIRQTLQLNNKRLFLSSALFDRDALVFENSQVNRMSLCSSKSAHKITLHCEDWPYFGVWAKKDCREFVCLEPWYGVADHVEHNGHLPHKQGIIQLDADREFNCGFTIHFT